MGCAGHVVIVLVCRAYVVSGACGVCGGVGVGACGVCVWGGVGAWGVHVMG